MSERRTRFTAAHPCPICHGHDRMDRGCGKRCYGYLWQNGEAAVCTREEHAGALQNYGDTNGYLHTLVGDCECGGRHDPRPPSANGNANGKGPVVVATYNYRDDAGKVLFQCVRYAPKSFKQRRPDGAGGWLWKLGDVQRVLYRLPEILAADPAEPVVVVEGEKDADTLSGLGFVATTSPMGAGKWRKSYAEPLRGRDVVVIGDNDDEGRGHAKAVAHSLQGVARSVRVIELDGLREHGDVSDWLDAGHTAQEFRERIGNATKAHAGTADPASDASTQPAWPTLDDAALYGLAGDIVRAIEPHTEADRAVLLGNVLVSFGNAGGREAYAIAEGQRHAMNINANVVGETSKGRKGSSRSRVEQIFELADVAWVNNHIVSGLSSGEGLIYVVRDAGDRRDKEGELTDPGVSDKRLLVVEEEFCTVLKRMAGETNTLSAIIRQAWDSGKLRVLNKNSPIKATGAHISVIGHATRPELKRELTDTEAANGFGNRFLWLCSRRSKCLPEGGGTPQWGDLAKRLREALAFARTMTQPVVRSNEARAIWAEVYPSLSEGQPGLVGALTSRAEAQVLRLSVIYAVMDKSPVVRPEHLMAALAYWDYAQQSARYIFGTASGNPIADRIVSALKDAGKAGMTSTQISGLFSRHAKAGQIHAALNELESAGLAGHKTAETEGRSCIVYHAL